MTERREFVKLVSTTKSGRIAVLARRSRDDTYVQVESVLGTEEAEKYADTLEHDDVERNGVIVALEDEDWGDDAPIG
jgi:hypothetical protein